MPRRALLISVASFAFATLLDVRHSTVGRINPDIALAVSRLHLDTMDDVSVLVFEFAFLGRAVAFRERRVSCLLRRDLGACKRRFCGTRPLLRSYRTLTRG